MKNFLKTTAILLVAFCFCACSNESDDFAPQSLEVTPNNISGYWVLSEYNGMEIPEGVFCYVEYIRKDRKFVMFQKFDSMYPRRLTGSYEITKDDYKGYILSGKYDYGTGDWNNSYIVTELYEESMLLTADAQSGDVCKYVRCNEVPDEIVDWFESAE